MKKHQITLTAEQAGEVLAPIISVVMSMNSDRAQYWIGRKNKLGREIRKILVGIDRNQYADLIQDWQNFYHDLGIDCELSNIHIPEDPGGFKRVLIMVPEITSQTAFDLCQKDFKCWKWTEKNLDEIVISYRNAKNSPYVIRIRDRVEADEELKNLSADQLKEQKIPGITLEERLIYELKYFKETGKHLDIENWTLCTSSRYSGGDVPHVYWPPRYGKMSVYWYHSDFRVGFFRSRQAVSLIL